MNVISAIILDANKNGRSFTFSIPLGSSYDESLEVLSEINSEILRMQEESKKLAKESTAAEEQK